MITREECEEIIFSSGLIAEGHNRDDTMYNHSRTCVFNNHICGDLLIQTGAAGFARFFF